MKGTISLIRCHLSLNYNKLWAIDSKTQIHYKYKHHWDSGVFGLSHISEALLMGATTFKDTKLVGFISRRVLVTNEAASRQRVSIASLPRAEEADIEEADIEEEGRRKRISAGKTSRLWFLELGPLNVWLCLYMINKQHMLLMFHYWNIPLRCVHWTYFECTD